ncbi:MAG: hypothetical protein J6S96_07030 [Muribaculaceae bacterium]|nr:hypothetical protein [Muribaculaceae bacterium]
MKLKFICFSIAAIITAATINAATYYGFYVGGVQVTSNNCNNITSSHIKAFNSNNSFSASYNPSTKTLTLDNVWIERTGSDNRAIKNDTCSGLKIVFVHANRLEAKDSSPVRLNANTTITSPNGYVSVIGENEDAITVNKATLTINDANLSVGANNSHAFVGNTGNEKLIIKQSNINAYTYKSDHYTIYNFASMNVESSRIECESHDYETQAVKNLKAFSMTGDKMCVLLYHFDSSKKSFVTTNGYAPNQITINRAVSFDDRTVFPDANFAEAVRWKPYGMADDYMGYYIQLPTKHHDGNADNICTSLYLTGQNISSVNGIEYLTGLKTLYCDMLDITSMNLLQNTKLETLWCSYCKLTSLYLPNPSVLTTLYCDHNNLKALNLSNSTALNDVRCNANPISALNVTPLIYLSKLNCDSCNLTTLDVSKCAPIKELHCSHNNLTSLTLPSDPGYFETLDCSYNNLTTLNVSPLYGLSTLWCNNNNISDLILSNFALLTSLRCQNNNISILNIDSCKKLEELDCSANKIKRLTLKWNTSLDRTVNCWGNQLVGVEMERLMNELPTSPYGRVLNLVDHTYPNEGNSVTATQVANARVQGWSITHKSPRTTSFTMTNGCENIDLKLAEQPIYSCYTSNLAELLNGITGTVNYDNSNHSLTMNNATITHNKFCINAGNSLSGFKLNLIGENSLNLTQPHHTAINIGCCVNSAIYGPGKLNINVPDETSFAAAIYLKNGINADSYRFYIIDCSLNMNGNCMISEDDGNNNLSIINSNLHMNNGYISTGYDLQLENCYISKPQGGHVYRGNLCAAGSNAYFTGEIEILAGSPVIPGIPGDVNGDSMVDVEDVNAAINIILKLKTVNDYPGNADVTDDGIIDVEDVNAIINIILKLA